MEAVCECAELRADSADNMSTTIYSRQYRQGMAYATTVWLFDCYRLHTTDRPTQLCTKWRSTGNDKNELCPLTKINVNWLNVNWAAFWTHQLYSLDVRKWAVLPEVWLWILAYLQLIEQLMFMHSAEIKVQALCGHQNPASSVYCKSTNTLCKQHRQKQPAKFRFILLTKCLV